MINNPELIKKIINQIKDVPLNILEEAINEVEKEDLYYDEMMFIECEQYKEDYSYNIAQDGKEYFEFIHKNSTSNNENEEACAA